MSGDFSRLTFDPGKRFDAVLLQQGRPQLDADWNEQRAIDAYRREVETRDVVGTHGAPREHAGFGIQLRAALQFDGRDDIVRIAPGGSLHERSLEHLTLELHVQPPADHAVGGVLVSAEHGQWRLEIEPDGRLAVRVHHNDGGEGAGHGRDRVVDALVSTRALALGQTTHVVLSCDGQRLRLWFDAERVGDADCPLGGRPHRAPASLGGVVGRGSAASAAHFAGQLADIRVWATVHTPETLLQHPSGTTLGPSPHLLAAWPLMGSDTPELLRDTSGHDNHLVLGDDTRRGSQPTWIGRDVLVGHGRLYVDGILCENDRHVLASQQPDAPGEQPVLGTRHSVVYLDVWKRAIDVVLDPGLADVALGGADTAIRSRVVWQVRTLGLEADPDAAGDRDWRDDWQAHLAHLESTATLRARRQAAAGTRLGNQLYRVEVHRPGRPGEATCTWSRDNASIVFGVRTFETPSGLVGLASLGRDSYALQTGDWVEYVDDTLELQHQPGPLLQVASVDRARASVVLAGDELALVHPDLDAHPRLRRWDQGELAAEVPIPDDPERWVDLEDGVQVAFGGGTYHTGDYWLIPARTVLEDVEWPVDRRTGPWARPPDGVRHHYCPLAVLHLDPERLWVQDERRLFDPLIQRPTPAAPADARRAPAGRPEHDGDLRVSGDLAVAGDAHLRGHVHVGRLSGELGPEIVQAHNLADGAVTQRALAPDVGLVPIGVSILGDSPEPPPGYVYAGASIVVDRPARHYAFEVDQPGAVSGVGLGDVLYLVSDLGSVWAFDFGDDRLRQVARLDRPRLELQALASDGHLLLVGGLDDDGNPTGLVSELELGELGWRPRAPLRLGRTQAGVVDLDGRVHVVGGRMAGGEASSQHDVYDVQRDAWATRAALGTPRSGLAAAAAGGRVFAIGGQERGRQWRGGTTGRTAAYDPQRDRWSELAPLPGLRRRLAAIGADERLVVAGEGPPTGTTTAAIGVAQRAIYEPDINWWSAPPPLACGPGPISLARVGSTIYAVTTQDTRIRLDAVQQTLYAYRKVRDAADRAAASEADA